MAVSVAIRKSGLDRGRGLFALSRFLPGDAIVAERPQMISVRGRRGGVDLCPDCGLPRHESPCDQEFGSPNMRSELEAIAWRSSPNYPIMASRLILKRILGSTPGSRTEIDWMSTLQSADLSSVDEVRQDWHLFLDWIGRHARPLTSSISEVFPFETFATVLGIVHRNSVEAGGAVALPGQLALINHSCDPNAQIADSITDGRLVLNGLREINAGEELSIAYIDPNLPWRERRSFLFRYYGFVCDCLRCRSQK